MPESRTAHQIRHAFTVKMDYRRDSQEVALNILTEDNEPILTEAGEFIGMGAETLDSITLLAQRVSRNTFIAKVN